MSKKYIQKQLDLNNSQLSIYKRKNDDFFYDYDQKKKQQAQSCGQIQDDKIQKKKENKNKLIIISPYFQQYQSKFLKNQSLPKIQQFQQNFLKLKIKQKKLQFAQIKIEKFSQSKSSKIVVYNVKLKFFQLQIHTLNLDKQDNFNFQYKQKFNEGMFGVAYSLKYNKKDIIIKKIKLKNTKQKSKQIQNAIKQYAIMKLCTAFQAAPSVQLIYGFDLIVSHDSIIFCMQKGVQILKYFQNLQQKNIQQRIQQAFNDLKKSLLLLHKHNITHNDIKPQNMIYSPSKDKLVFIDFGMSQVNSQKVGQMKLQKSKGSYYYCCKDMKKLFKQSIGLGYVDMYYNDFYGLDKSLKTIESYFLNVQNKNSQENNNIQRYTIENKSNEKQSEQILSIFIINLIYFSDLSSIDNLIQNKQLELINILNKYLDKIYIVFFESIYNLSLFHAYQKLKKILFDSRYKIQISRNSRQIFSDLLQPYFKPFIQYHQKQFILQRQKIFKKYVKQQKNSFNKQIKLVNKNLLTNQQSQQTSPYLSLDINNNLKIKLNTLYSLKQSAYKIINFLQEHPILIELMIQIFQKTNSRITIIQSVWLDIDEKYVQQFIQMFENISIEIQFQQIRFSTQFFSISNNWGKIVAIFQILQEISLFFIQNFDIFDYFGGKILQKSQQEFNLISKQNIQLVQFKLKKLFSKNVEQEILENQPNKDIHSKNIDLKYIQFNFFMCCIQLLSSQNKIIENYVQYEVSSKKTQQILQILIIFIIKIMSYKLILFQQNQNYQNIYEQVYNKIQYIIQSCLDNYYKIIFHSFFKSEQNFDIFRLLKYYERLYSFEKNLHEKIAQFYQKNDQNLKNNIISKLSEVYNKVLAKNKHFEWKIKQFHSLMIDLMIFLQSYQIETVYNKFYQFIKASEENFLQIHIINLELIKMSLIRKFYEYLIISTKFEQDFWQLFQLININQNTILKNLPFLVIIRQIFKINNHRTQTMDFLKRINYFKNKIKQNQKNKIQMYLNPYDYINENTKNSLSFAVFDSKKFVQTYFISQKKNNILSEQQIIILWKIINSLKIYSFFDKNPIINIVLLVIDIHNYLQNFTEQEIGCYCQQFFQELKNFQQLINFQILQLSRYQYLIRQIHAISDKEQNLKIDNFQNTLQTVKQNNLSANRYYIIYNLLYWMQNCPCSKLIFALYICENIFKESNQQKDSLSNNSLNNLYVVYLQYSFKTQLNYQQRLNKKIKYQQQVKKYLIGFNNKMYRKGQSQKIKLFYDKKNLKQYKKILQALYENQIQIDSQNINKIFHQRINNTKEFQNLILRQFVNCYFQLFKQEKFMMKIYVSVQYCILAKFIIKAGVKQLLNGQQFKLNRQIFNLDRKYQNCHLISIFFEHFLKNTQFFTYHSDCIFIILYTNYFKHEFQMNIIQLINTENQYKNFNYLLVKNVIRLQSELLDLYFYETDYNKIIKNLSLSNQKTKYSDSSILFLLINIKKLIFLIFYKFYQQKKQILNNNSQQLNSEEKRQFINIIKIQIQKFDKFMKLVYSLISYPSKLIKRNIIQTIFSLLALSRQFIQINTEFINQIQKLHKFINKPLEYYHFKLIKNIEQIKLSCLYSKMFFSQNLFNKERLKKQIKTMQNYPLDICLPVDSIKFITRKINKNCQNYINLSDNKYTQSCIRINNDKILNKFNKYLTFI